jgi:indolepyruvate ferredoxin oxidoreductase beta subunit
MTVRPITVLVAALGGEGGGVLANWVIAAAARHGLQAQSTSIPGVAQRTGATTYYLEVMPVSATERGGRQAILALAPGVGDVDILLASELMEAARTVAAGFVTPGRTLVLASTSRALVMDEKLAMGDGRLDSVHLAQTIATHAQRALLLDMDAIARRAGAIVNAVMLGVLAGCGRLPIPQECFEAAIREDGKAVEANLRAFRAGLEAALAQPPQRREPASEKRAQPRTVAELEASVTETMPEPARATAIEGVRRLVHYQDLAYARLYLERLARVQAADGVAGAGGALLAATARHLAVRMSFEDVIRVAQAKIDPARFERIAKEMRIAPGTPYALVEFLKPGVEEICAVLPPWLARRVLAMSARRSWLARLHWPMRINTASVTGYARFRLLAALKRWRPSTHRFHEEQRDIEAWLVLIVGAAQRSPALAIEIAECARLIKGYGDTFKRGSSNYAAIAEKVIGPALEAKIPLATAIDAVASARAAALLDPDGQSLAKCLAQVEMRTGTAIAAE